MWTKFEWENRVNVNYPLSWLPPSRFDWKWNTNATFISDAREYLKHVKKTTNMSCLTPESAISGGCDFLSANMYARSLFGSHSFF
jgi:coatomer subunit beta